MGHTVVGRLLLGHTVRGNRGDRSPGDRRKMLNCDRNRTRLSVPKGVDMDSGIVRKVDALGRVVIPSATRRLFNLREGDGLTFSG